MSDMRKCDGCGVLQLNEDLHPGALSKVYCTYCYKQYKKSIIELLKNIGYLVVNIPNCKTQGSHGKHVLITRSYSCPGVDPSHGYNGTYYGTFGPWIMCKCGYEFSDYGESPTHWQKHKVEYE
jgi:hypothetical protein